ncbi:hypothetical protein Fmac_032353 [Flemingia macrophylla]|uniref:ACB domain-containing protein n=1 Tax=Flemingia macrophylla TaxID=520843 RepID=A0ABD1L4Q7_9FABA
MELLTVVDDFFVTASVALLLTLIAFNFVKAMNDTHTSPKRHVHREPLRPVSHAERLTVQPAQSKSKVGFINPVQPTTCVGTKRSSHEPEIEPVGSVPTVQPGQSDSTGGFITFQTEGTAEATVEPVRPAQSKSTAGSMSPVQAMTCAGSEDKKEEATIESEADIAAKDEEKRNVESVDEIRVVEEDDDDWEGIERSEVEKEFMAATEFVRGLGSNVQMELYGLHKVAIQGPCLEPPPMPLKLSARAKWNAWQKLGNMSPEVAMEQYISLLSDKFPGWMKDTSAGMSEHEPTRLEVSDSAASDICTTSSHQQMTITERFGGPEQVPDVKDHSPLTESDLENNVNI